MKKNYHRPDIINKREEFGHWEGDLMIFKQGIKSNLITLRERKTRFIVAIKNLNKTASDTALTLISTVKNIKKHIAELIREINNRPLKCLGYKTPQEIFLVSVSEQENLS